MHLVHLNSQVSNIMFDKIFSRKSNILLHSHAPLLNERIQYLQYWEENGAVKATLQRIAQIILSIADNLNLKGKKFISVADIKEVAEKWDKQRRKNGVHIKFATISKSSYIHHARFWLHIPFYPISHSTLTDHSAMSFR